MSLSLNIGVKCVDCVQWTSFMILHNTIEQKKIIACQLCSMLLNEHTFQLNVMFFSLQIAYDDELSYLDVFQLDSDI